MYIFTQLHINSVLNPFFNSIARSILKYCSTIAILQLWSNFSRGGLNIVFINSILDVGSLHLSFHFDATYSRWEHIHCSTVVKKAIHDLSHIKIYLKISDIINLFNVMSMQAFRIESRDFAMQSVSI